MTLLMKLSLDPLTIEQKLLGIKLSQLLLSLLFVKIVNNNNLLEIGICTMYSFLFPFVRKKDISSYY